MRRATRDSLCLGVVVQLLAIASIATTAQGQVVGDSTGARADTAAAAAPRDMYPGVPAGSRREDYLRSLQIVGLVRPYPWSLRGFSPRELDLLRPQSDSHPRAALREFRADSAQLPLGLRLVPANADAWFNSGFPFGINDGAVWRGRGVTTAISGGVQGRWGPVSLTVAPTAFWAQNRSFELMPNGVEGPLGFGDGQYAGGIDLPQRFGNDAYVVLDPGQSALRIDTRFVTTGVSTANQTWGPMNDFPFIIGDNAAGFPHVFVGTGSPVNVYVGSLHARVMYGQLGQSDYSPITGPETRRFTSGIIAVFSPRGVPGLELGASRLFQMVWPEGGPTSWEFRRPFESLFKSALREDQRTNDDPLTHVENQLASVFFRWAFPGHGMEVYGETGREDHSWDFRDLMLELEHAGTYGFGLRKAWRRADRLTVFRAETMKFQTRGSGLHRGEGQIYLHSPIRQGHTHRGQLLGAGFGIGSAGGTTAAFERHTPRGSTVVSWSRYVRAERFREFLRTPWEVVTDESDVQHAVEVEHRIDHDGRQLRFGAGAIYEFNRNLDHDAFNLSLSAGVDLYPARRSARTAAPPRPSTAQ